MTISNNITYTRSAYSIVQLAKFSGGSGILRWGGGGGAEGAWPLPLEGMGSAVSSPIAVWGEAPEACEVSHY